MTAIFVFLPLAPRHSKALNENNFKKLVFWPLSAPSLSLYFFKLPFSPKGRRRTEMKMFIKHPQEKKTSFDFLTFGKEGGGEGSMLEGVPRDRGDAGRNL